MGWMDLWNGRERSYLVCIVLEEVGVKDYVGWNQL